MASLPVAVGGVPKARFQLMTMASLPVPAGGVPKAISLRHNYVPRGYRFRPTDEELLRYYLKRKIDNEPLLIKEISEVKLYDYNPNTLTERYPPIGDNGWYFLSARERKYKNGLRPNRRAGTGFWKATGKDKKIKNTTGSYEGIVLGYKRILVFHEGKPPKGIKTNWIMHEYTLGKPNESRRGSADMKLDDWVLCRIFKKAKKSKDRKRKRDQNVESVTTSTTAREDQSLNSEENKDDHVKNDNDEQDPLLESKISHDQVLVMENHDQEISNHNYNNELVWMNDNMGGDNYGFDHQISSVMNDINVALYEGNGFDEAGTLFDLWGQYEQAPLEQLEDHNHHEEFEQPQDYEHLEE